jgi:hypothetical protein
MNHLHEMLIEDEILLCGLVTALGFLTGAAARLARTVWRDRVFKVR